MDGSYEFLADLRRLVGIYRRFEQSLYLINAGIIASLIYIATLFLGIPAFFRFYWQDSIFVSTPAIFSLILGLLGGKIMGRWSKSDFFGHLDESLSEKTKAAYDNRDSDSVVMRSLAEDVKRRLSKVGVFDLINNRRLNFGDRSVPIFQAKAGALILLLAFVAIFSQSQAGEVASPQPFKALTDLRERAAEIFGEEELPEGGESSAGISGEIYGKPSLAVLEEVNLELVLYPGTAAGFRSTETDPMDRLFQTSEAGEGVAVPTDLYIESLPPQHREIIKRYFENLATGF
ncbi:MAG: hypothetical protein WCY97_00925 [Methanothrix sp.]|uniref:Uncharacterized protein n=1 Tax=Methanothrix harundinacea TaxID=301375 RepID=A0A101FW80_9EURY|nr:MAG: hypothetical protein APR56_03660 [Methanosaeta sp. SDB]KUK45594.1 MAG: Uncharacterized protein XD72_0068 [Methanothrix harundinacea]MDD2638417.1 hypothetical protein [Methanothrix sp.]MDI9398119.1 hypothetical protein [Euryarchaeota archaeon]KUK96503.1 MAG: Uncharacterized protein XE07_1070 [Methanothrix harundinacea]